MSSPIAANSRGVNALLFLFIGSGCAALIYEVVWYQSLSLIVGSNSVSMAVVLATYMGGMSLGSLAFLRWKGRHGNPLLIYAKLELLIALSALLVLYVLPYAGGLYFAIGGSGPLSVLVRGLFCALFLLVPTMAMGATLPAASAWLRTTPQGVSRIGAYYTTNMLGGVCGALFAGFYLLRVHDMQIATFVAMALNLLIALVAYMVARGGAAFAAADSKAVDEQRDVTRGEVGVAPRMVLFTIAMSGACALGAEVIWARNLALLMGGTVYTFSLILAAVLLGLTIGSSVGTSAVRTTRSPRMALALCQIGAMLGLAWAAWWQLQALPNWPINPSLAPSMWFNFQLDFVRALWSMLPAAVCWGASFPLAIAALAQTETSSSRAVARIYAANTLGAIGGALISSLILLQFIGTQKTQWLFMFMALLGAVAMLLPVATRNAPSRLVPNRVAWLAAVVVLFILSAPLVHTVPGILAGYGRWAVTWLKDPRKFIYVGEGLNATLAVSETQDGSRYYHNAGKVQASSIVEDMRLQRMLGHITTLVARNPKNVLVIGCGAGVTAGAVSINPDVKTQTIAEIEPLVPRVVSKYFANENYNVIQNPKVTVHLDDARHFLLTTNQMFDAITADPFDVWVKGSATLNTLEFYREMKKHLNPGGVVTAWVAFYETDSAAWKSELATFMEVFPHAMVFGNTSGGGGYDGVLVGSAEPLSIDVSAIEAKLRRPEFAEVRRSLTDVNYPDAISLFGTFAADASQLSGYLSGAQINRDRNLRLQYLAGMAVNRYEQADLYANLKTAGGWKEGLFKGDDATLEQLRAIISGP
ncbi:MAG: fused MFS/spermidine synthase [Steroidobacteraceae bacterium]